MAKELLTSDQRPSRGAAEEIGRAVKIRCDKITAAETVQWLTDRLTNCIRLGALKAPDRDGWIEDAAQFAAALNLLALKQDAPSLFKGVGLREALDCCFDPEPIDVNGGATRTYRRDGREIAEAIIARLNLLAAKEESK